MRRYAVGEGTETAETASCQCASPSQPHWPYWLLDSLIPLEEEEKHSNIPGTGNGICWFTVVMVFALGREKSRLALAL